MGKEKWLSLMKCCSYFVDIMLKLRAQKSSRQKGRTIMKHNKLFALVMTAVLTVSAAAMSGCDKVKEAAGTVKNAVTSMADQVNNFDSNVDASKLDEVLKNFYSGIKSGTINETTRGQYVTATLPAANAISAERDSAAANVTVFSALEEQGMTNHFTEDYIQEFVSLNGDIKAKNAVTSETGATIQLTYNSTLAEVLAR